MQTAKSTTLPTTAVQRRARLTITIGYCAAFVGLGLTYASLGPTLTDLASNTGTALNAISYVFTTRSLGYLIGSFLGGRLYDRMPGNPVMGTMLLLMAVSMALVPLIPLLWLLTAMLLLLGMFEGALDVGGNTLLVWVHGGKVGPFMNALHFFFGIGAFLSPVIIARAVLIGGSVTWAYWALAALLVPIAVGVLRLPSPDAPAEAVASPDDTATATPRRTNGVMVVLVAAFLFLYVGAEGGFGGWIATYAKAMGLGDAVTAAYLTSVFWGALTLGRLLSIPLAVRFRPQALLLADLVGCLISVLVVILWPGVPAATWIGTFGAGFSMASLFPITISFAERHMTITGKITSWFFVGASIGGMSIPWLIGQLFESYGPRITPLVILASVMLNVAIFGIIVRYVRKAESKG